MTRDVISAPMDTADQTAWAGGSEMWLNWQDYILLPVQSDQLCSIGADMTSATSLSLSIYLQLITLWQQRFQFENKKVMQRIAIFCCGQKLALF